MRHGLLPSFVLLILACGGGEKPAAVLENTPAPPPAPQGGLEGIRSRGVLKVATDPDAPPFVKKAADGGYEGFEYSIMKSIADRAGVPVSIVGAPFPELIDKVKSGEADLAIGQVSPSEAYTDVAWSVSYLQYSFCLVVPKTSSVKGMKDLAGKRVGMYDDPIARQLADVLIGSAYERTLFEDYGYFEMVARGQLDAMVYDCPLARYEMTIFDDKLKIVDDALNVATYAVGVPVKDTVLLGEVNGVLKDLGQQGLLGALEERWLGEAVKAENFESDTGKVVVVKKGDTLSVIAGRELGTTEKWRELHAANADVIGADPNVIYAGMRLRLPR